FVWSFFAPTDAIANFKNGTVDFSRARNRVARRGRFLDDCLADDGADTRLGWCQERKTACDRGQSRAQFHGSNQSRHPGAKLGSARLGTVLFASDRGGQPEIITTNRT